MSDTTARPALTITACLATLAASGLAHAQSNGAEPASDELQQIVVTGTHIARRGFQEPTPTTVVDSQLLEDRAPSVLVDALKSLPQFRNIATPSSAGLSTASSGGQSFIDLRGLGPNRSLVLFNGQRMVPTTSIETVDVALLPQALISRIDVVTGGASAVYGSDAVSGVANFVIDTKYEGLKGNAEGGVSSRGDAGERKASIVWGAKATDRLHVIASAEYYKSDGLNPQDRNFQTAYGVASNPAFQAGNGQSPLVLRNYVYFPNETFGGLIVGGPLANSEFLPGGVVAPFTPCPIRTASYQLCDSQRDQPYLHYVTRLASPQQRATGYGRVTFAASDTVSLYADALYAKSETDWNILPPTTNLNGLVTIRNDNAFLPASVSQQMTALGLPSFQLGRTFADLGFAPSTKDASVWRMSSGLDATLGERWKANAYTSYGRSELVTTIGDTINMPLLRRAIDSVISPTTGQPICRSTLTNPNDACVPVNIFGNGSPSAAAIASFSGDQVIDLDTRQLAVGANLSTEPFATWAGPVSVAFGGEYRSEKVDQTVDAISLVDGWAYNNPKPLNGKIDVKEGYVETVIPLASELRFARNLELNAGARITDYSTSGTVETWKVGANYAPFEALHFRVTRSRDIRAPNVVELNSPAFQVTAGDPVIDPRNNASLLVPRWTSGNSTLDPEIANTFSAGIVVQPAALAGFSGSLDFYRVQVGEAISTLTSQEILNGCQSGNTALCPLVLRDGSGAPTRVTSAFLNLSQIETSGFDIELEYRLDLGRFNSTGTTTFRALGNYLREYVVNNGFTQIDYAGDIGTLNLPKWGWDVSAQYERGPWSVLVDANYIGKGEYRVTFDRLLANNAVEDAWYLNTAVVRNFDLGTTRLRAYLNLDNVFDKDPPFGFGNGGNTGLSGGSYTRLGRMVKVGFRIEL